MFFILGAVTACGEPPDALATVPGDPAAAVVLVVGIEHREDGQYTLRVAGDGQVSLHNRQAGKSREWTARWDGARVEAFVDEMRQNGFLTVKPPSGQRQPGDVPLVLRVDGPRPYEVRLWEADRYALPGVDRIVTRLDALTKELSAGAGAAP